MFLLCILLIRYCCDFVCASDLCGQYLRNMQAPTEFCCSRRSDHFSTQSACSQHTRRVYSFNVYSICSAIMLRFYLQQMLLMLCWYRGTLLFLHVADVHSWNHRHWSFIFIQRQVVVLVAWLSGNTLVSTSLVTVHQTQLILGEVTIGDHQVNHLCM